MIQATTPSFILILPETVDLTTAQAVYATFRQHSSGLAHKITTKLTKTLGPDMYLDGTHTINVMLTQAESLQFTPGLPAEAQVNWITAANRREATRIAEFEVSENLIPEVITL